MHFRMLAVALCALAGLAGNARAAISYQYVTDQSVYNATAGQDIVISVFLQETLTDGSRTLVGPAGQGAPYALASVSVGVNRTSGNSLFKQDPGGAGFEGRTASYNQNFNITANSPDPDLYDPDGFQQVFTSQNLVNGGIVVAAISNFPRMATVTTNQTYRVLVGTLTITAGTTNSTYSLVGGNFADPQTSAGNNGRGTTATSTALQQLLDLDVNGTNVTNPNGTATTTYSGTTSNPYSFTVQVAAIPEPSSMILGGMVVVGGAFGAWRRRKSGEPITVA